MKYFDFSQALKHLRQGKKVRQTDWNPKDYLSVNQDIIGNLFIEYHHWYGDIDLFEWDCVYYDNWELMEEK